MSDEKIIIKIDSIIAPLIPDFMKNRENDITTLNTALSDKDFETLRITGHNLKGCGAGYGFQGITDIGAKIETAAVDQDTDDIQTLIGELTHYLDNVEPQYD